MKLYYHPLSTYSQKVLIALHEKNVEVQPEVVTLTDPGARERYREVYPMGKVPLLVLDDGHLIPESSIIIEYLDSLGGARLIPEDPELARKTRFKDRMFDLYLTDSVGTLFFQSLKPEAEQDAERIETAKFRINVMYQFMEREFAGQRFANGDTFSMADCAAAAALFYAPKVLPFDAHVNIKAYWDRLCHRPSVKQVHHDVAPHLEAFNKRSAA